jgi:hypothetical protein
MRNTARLRAAAVVVTVALAGCGSASSPDEVERLEQRVQDAEQKAADARAAAEDARNDTESSGGDNTGVTDEEPTEDAGEGDGSGCIEVPDVVGKDHQLAQDTMQAAGLYMLMEEDASGQGRMLLLDRNWTTVRQKPNAGACVNEDTEITLYAVKDGER